MAELSISKLMLAATSIFISGLIVFYVVFYGMTLWQRVQVGLGNKTLSPEAQQTMSLLKIIPTVLVIMYILVVVAVVYYLIFAGSKEKEIYPTSPYEPMYRYR